MWEKVVNLLRNHPERRAVFRILVENGLRIDGERVFCNNLRIPIVEVARNANVDRRTVLETIKWIRKHSDILTIFTNLRSAGLSLTNIARHYNFGVVEITPSNPEAVGILAGAANIISKKKISIRQVITDDPTFSPEPKLTIITAKKLPGSLVPKFLEIEGVSKVTIY